MLIVQLIGRHAGAYCPMICAPSQTLTSNDFPHAAMVHPASPQMDSSKLQIEVASDQPAFVLTDWELITAEIDSDVDATLGHSVQS